MPVQNNKNSTCFSLVDIFELKRTRMLDVKKMSAISCRLRYGISLPNAGNEINKKADKNAITGTAYLLTIRYVPTAENGNNNW
jgi:hypothetical protein